MGFRSWCYAFFSERWETAGRQYSLFKNRLHSYLVLSQTRPKVFLMLHPVLEGSSCIHKHGTISELRHNLTSTTRSHSHDTISQVLRYFTSPYFNLYNAAAISIGVKSPSAIGSSNSIYSRNPPACNVCTIASKFAPF